MLGAIAGDIIGSVYESRPVKTADFVLFDGSSTFTDDTVLTIAIADAILQSGDYVQFLKKYARKYPNAGYGYNFSHWMLCRKMELVAISLSCLQGKNVPSTIFLPCKRSGKELFVKILQTEYLYGICSSKAID